MHSRPFEPGDLALVVGWLADPDNARWLDFGPQPLPPHLALQWMARRPDHLLRIYAADRDGAPTGFAALSPLNRRATVMNLWYLLGDKRHARTGLTSRAVAYLLNEGFQRPGLAAIRAWTVPGNVGSIRVLLGNGFRVTGRLRRCHDAGEGLSDRVLFDRLSTDPPHRPLAPGPADAAAAGRSADSEISAPDPRPPHFFHPQNENPSERFRAVAKSLDLTDFAGF